MKDNTRIQNNKIIKTLSQRFNARVLVYWSMYIVQHNDLDYHNHISLSNEPRSILHGCIVLYLGAI